MAGTAGLLVSLITAVAPVAAGDAQAAAAPTVGAVTIGVTRIENGARVFYLTSSLVDGGGQVTRVVFGNADDVPTLAQNDAGQCEPAVYRNSNATFYQASASVNGGGTVTATQFGNAGDIPSQNATRSYSDGDHRVNLRRPSNATFYALVISQGNTAKVQADQFGDPSDVGFYGAGGTYAYRGVYRPGTSTFYFQNPDDPVPTTVQQFGSRGDQGLFGAYVATATGAPQQDYVGVFRPSAGRWFLAKQAINYDGTQQPPITNVQTFTFGSPGDTALSCDNGGQA